METPEFVATLARDLVQIDSRSTISNLPMTVFLNCGGRVADVHLGAYLTAASLDNDIEQYAFGLRG